MRKSIISLIFCMIMLVGFVNAINPDAIGNQGAVDNEFIYSETKSADIADTNIFSIFDSREIFSSIFNEAFTLTRITPGDTIKQGTPITLTFEKVPINANCNNAIAVLEVYNINDGNNAVACDINPIGTIKSKSLLQKHITVCKDKLRVDGTRRKQCAKVVTPYFGKKFLEKRERDLGIQEERFTKFRISGKGGCKGVPQTSELEPGTYEAVAYLQCQDNNQLASKVLRSTDFPVGTSKDVIDRALDIRRFVVDQVLSRPQCTSIKETKNRCINGKQIVFIEPQPSRCIETTQFRRRQRIDTCVSPQSEQPECIQNSDCNDGNLNTVDRCLVRFGTCSNYFSPRNDVECDDNDPSTYNLLKGDGSCEFPIISTSTDLRQIGQSCSSNSQCTNLNCINNICTILPSLGLSDGSLCSYAGQCNSGACVAGQCGIGAGTPPTTGEPSVTLPSGGGAGGPGGTVPNRPTSGQVTLCSLPNGAVCDPPGNIFVGQGGQSPECSSGWCAPVTFAGQAANVLGGQAQVGRCTNPPENFQGHLACAEPSFDFSSFFKKNQTIIFIIIGAIILLALIRPGGK